MIAPEYLGEMDEREDEVVVTVRHASDAARVVVPVVQMAEYVFE